MAIMDELPLGAAPPAELPNELASRVACGSIWRSGVASANAETVMKERSVMLKVKWLIRMRARSFSKLSG
jgi:hypothetical protein